MAGSTVGKVNCYYSRKPVIAQQQEGFKNLFDFFELMVTAGYATRIALQFGLVVVPSATYPQGLGSGTDYFDGAAPFGENAFALFRMNGATSGNASSRRNGVDLPDFDYYVLIQWADTTFGVFPGDPGKIDASAAVDGTAVCIAARLDGGNPWAGGTANDGTDAKAATVWTAGGSTLFTVPISNSYTAGAHLATAENMRRVYDLTGTSTQATHIVGNADSFAIAHDTATDGTYTMSYFGIYSPRTGLTPPIPLCSVTNPATVIPWVEGTATQWGTTAGNSQYEGGVVGQLAADLMSPLNVGQTVTGVLEIFMQPNAQFDPPEFDAFPIRIAQRSAGRAGYVGDLDASLIRAVYAAPSNSMSADGAWGYFGPSIANAIRHTLAWDAAVGSPGTYGGRVGEEF